MKMSECYQDAARRLWNGLRQSDGFEYCCHAIRSTASPHHVKEACIREIGTRLGEWHTVLDWLYWSTDIPREELDDASDEVIQDYRKRWLLALAEEFKAKGM